MSIRKAVLIVALLSSTVATCAEEPGFEIAGASIQTSPTEVLCHRCTVKLVPSMATHFEAARISLDKESGAMYLDGSVRVTFQGGRELRAEHVAMRTESNGVQDLSGDEFRIVNAASL